MINHGLQMLALTSMMEDTDSKASGQEGDHSAQEGAPSAQEGNTAGQEVEKHINLKVITGMEL